MAGVGRFGPKPKPLSERLWAKVRRSDGCWEWTGKRLPRGYGQIRINEPRVMVLTHRVSYELAFGPIPEGMNVCHRCDNPPCVRPDHLFLGTTQENATDRKLKGRGHRRTLREGEWRRDVMTVEQARQLVVERPGWRVAVERFGISKSSYYNLLSDARVLAPTRS